MKGTSNKISKQGNEDPKCGVEDMEANGLRDEDNITDEGQEIPVGEDGADFKLQNLEGAKAKEPNSKDQFLNCSADFSGCEPEKTKDQDWSSRFIV